MGVKDPGRNSRLRRCSLVEVNVQSQGLWSADSSQLLAPQWAYSAVQPNLDQIHTYLEAVAVMIE